MTRGVSAAGPERSLQRLDRLCAAVSMLLPGLFAAARASAALEWQRDMAAVRALGFVPVGGEGALSAALSQLALLLPLGGRVLRLSLIGALAAMLAGYCCYRLTRRLLESCALGGRVAPVLAGCSAVLATALPTWQLESTRVGGAAVPAALVLAAVWSQCRAGPALAPLPLGMLLGATVVEDRSSGLLLSLLLLAIGLTQRRLPTRRDAAELGLGAGMAGALLVVPMTMWQAQSLGWLEFGSVFQSAPAGGNFEPWPWLREVGPLELGLALAGAAATWLVPAARPLALALGVALGVDLLVPSAAETPLVPDRGAGVQLVAAAILMCFSGLGAAWLVAWLGRSRLPFAQRAGALIVVLQLTAVLITADDSGYTLGARTTRAVDVWTEEAISSLPPKSLMLVRSEPVAWRLWAAALAHGERPDVIMVPVPLVFVGDVPSRLLAQEPALAPLVRELIVSGRPTELALSTLSDARPVYVEFDPSWDPRLLGHLLPEGLWLRFIAHDLGQSDRAQALRQGRSALSRVVTSAADLDRPDPATLAIIADRAREQLAVMAALGDRAAALVLEAELGRILPGDQVLTAIQARLARSKRRDLSLIRLLE